LVLVIVVIFAADSIVGGGCDKLSSHDPQTTSSAYYFLRYIYTAIYYLMSHRYYTAFVRNGIPHGRKVGFRNFPHNPFLFE